MSTTPEPKKRRSCLGSFFMGGLGCFAFAAGAIVILIVLVPRIVAGWVPGMIEDGFAKSFRGTVEVDAVKLAWSARQKVSDLVLRGPDGAEVGRATLVVPSIFDFFSDGRKTLEVELEAELVADDDGVTNLERAFEPNPETKVDLGGAGGGDGDGDGQGWLEAADLELIVRSRRVSWSDAVTRAAGQPFELRDLVLTARLVPDEPKTLALDAVIQGAAPSTLELDVAFAGRVRDLVQLDLSGLELDLKAKGLSVGMLDGLAGLRGALVAMFGQTIDVTAHVADPLGAKGSFSIDLKGEERHLRGAGAMRDGAFHIEADRPCTAAFGVPLERVVELARPYLPEGAELVPGDRHGAATFDAHQLVVPASSIESFGRGDWLTGLRDVRGHVVIEAPVGLYYTDPTTQANGVILGISSMHVEALSEEDNGPLRGSLYTSTDTGEPGDVELAFKLGRPGTSEPDLAYFDLQVRQISSTAIDGYLELDGCFFEAMGPTFGFRAEGDGLTRTAGELMAFVRAPGLSGNVHGHVEDGVLVLAPEHGLNAIFRPAPGWFERCVVREVGDGWALNLLLAEDEGLHFLTDGMTVPLPEEWTEEGVLAALGEARGKTSFKLGTWRFARTGADGEQQLVGFENVELAAELTEDGTLGVLLESGLFTGEAGTFSLAASVPEAPLALRGGDLAGVELDVAASGVSDTLLRAVLGPLLPDGTTLVIDTEESAELHWKGGGVRRAALDTLDGLSGDLTLALHGVRYATEGFALGLSGVTAGAALGGKELSLTLEAGVEDGAVASLLGDRVSAGLTLFGPGADTGAGALDATLTTPRLTGRAAGRFEGGGFSTRPDDHILLEWRPTEAALRELLGTSLAPGQTLAPAAGDAGAPVSLAIKSLRLPGPSGTPTATGSADASFTAQLAGLACDVDVTFPTLVFRDGATAASVSISDLRIAAVVRPEERPTLELRGMLTGSGAEPALLRGSVRALQSFGALGEDGEPRFELDVSGSGLPTPLIDALAQAEGLLVDVFGPRVDVVATSPGLGPRNGSFHAQLVSDRASTTFDGELRHGVLTTAVDGGLDATLGLTPLFSRRIVGPLLPLVVDIEKPADAAPAAFRVHSVAFPLDGDLSRLDAIVQLDLGDVIYRLLPGIESSFLGELTKARLRRVRPVTVRIVQGVAHYDGLPVDVRGHALGFRGTFGLVDGKLALDADVPLAALGSDLTQKVEGYVGKDATIPVRIGGTPKIPSLKVSLEALMQSAAGGLLDKWLRKK